MRLIFLITLVMLSLVSCVNRIKETPNGLEFKIIEEGDGDLPKVGQVVTFNFKLVDSKDSIWNETYSRGTPAAVHIRDSIAKPTETGLMQMLRMVSCGDSILVELTVPKYFREIAKRPIPVGLDTTRKLYYHVSIDTILNRKDYSLLTRSRKQLIKQRQHNKDVEIIEKYLDENEIKATKTESGLFYVIIKQGSGPNGKSGQTVTVNYSGYFLDGKYFESNVTSIAKAKGIYDATLKSYKPFEVIIDKSPLIDGWQEALKLLNKGSKATFYIPSTLAYGKDGLNGTVKIEEDTILIFDIEVLDIK